MKRRILVVLAVAVPVLLFVNVFQAYRYSQLEREIERLEIEQQALIEANQEAILALSVLSSPQRIVPLAEGELGLSRAGEESIVRMESSSSEESE